MQIGEKHLTSWLGRFDHTAGTPDTVITEALLAQTFRVRGDVTINANNITL
jgi:hypothetical protein